MIQKSSLFLAVFALFFLVSGVAPAPSPAMSLDPAPSLTPSLDSLGDEVYRYFPPKEYREWVEWYCREQGLYVDLISRQIWEESRWDPLAENTSGEATGRGTDRGLMQINSRNWVSWCRRYNGGVVGDPFDPQTNLRVGIRAMGDYVRTHRYRLSFVRWNAGHGRLDNPPQSTLAYVARILGN